MQQQHSLLCLMIAAALAGCSPPVKKDGLADADLVSAPRAAPASAAPGVAGQSSVAAVQVEPPRPTPMGPSGERIVYFDYDSFSLRPDQQHTVENNAQFVRSDRNRRILVEGHTDERGGREYNLALGQQRAEAVRRALGLLGVVDGQIEAVSFGEERPIALGADEAAFAKNRRAEIRYP